MRFQNFSALTHGRQTDTTISDIELRSGHRDRGNTPGELKPMTSMKQLDGLQVQVDWSQECNTI
jgi:hypothetical protein